MMWVLGMGLCICSGFRLVLCSVDWMFCVVFGFV